MGRRVRSSFGARAGFCNRTISTGEQRYPLANQRLEQFFEAAFNHFYAGAGVTSVRLPREPAAEIAMSTGVRPKIGNIDLDLGLDLLSLPTACGTPPVGTMADINYWEFLARADTSFGESLHLAAGSGVSPNYSNTGAWSDYHCIWCRHRLAAQIKLVRDFHCGSHRRCTEGYFWFGNQSAALGGFPLPRIFELERGRNLSRKKTYISTYAITATNLSGRTVLCSHRGSQRRVRRAHGRGYEPGGGRISNWCSGDLRRQILVRTELDRVH